MQRPSNVWMRVGTLVALMLATAPVGASARASRALATRHRPAAHPAPGAGASRTAPALASPACARPEGGLVTPTTDLATWSRIEANSEQRQPVYLGLTPRQMALGMAAADAPAILPEAFRRSGRSIFPVLSRAVQHPAAAARAPVSFEAWPVLDDEGRATWAVARWRVDHQPWAWLDATLLSGRQRGRPLEPPPLLPETLHPSLPAERAAIFDDVTQQPGLYDKPAFGDCAWTTASGSLVEAWEPLDLREKRATAAAQAGPSATVCRRIPQPARLNGRSWTFEIQVQPDGRVDFPGCLRFEPLPAIPLTEPRPALVTQWPPGIEDGLRADVRVLSGEDETVLPDGRPVRFTRRNAIDPLNQLEPLVDWLEARYKALGLQTRRQRFPWHGVPQSNLVVVIPGTAKDAGSRPILLADHVDTAFCEDVYDRTWQRVSAPGADDNGAATAALLMAARVLKDSHPLRDIWLVHLAGEEFPADDLGARRFLAAVLARKQDRGPLGVRDMIGWRAKGDPVFQVSPGRSAESADVAAIAAGAALAARGFKAAVRPIFDPQSYLYNTDGWVFDAAGFPVILLNEHLSRAHSMQREGYHDTLDRSDRIDWAYAAAITRTAIETVARLAGVPTIPQR